MKIHYVHNLLVILIGQLNAPDLSFTNYYLWLFWFFNFVIRFHSWAFICYPNLMASSCKFVNYMFSFHSARPKLIIKLELLVVEPLQERDPRPNNTSFVFLLPSLGLRFYIKSCPPPPHKRALSFFLICLNFFSYFFYKHYEGGY